MILLARALARLLAFLLLVALAVVGLAAAVFCIGKGTGTLSLHNLADIVALPQARDQVGSFLDTLEAPGSTAVLSALGGLAAMGIGLVLLVGILVPRRERLVSLTRTKDGTIAARRRPLGQIAVALVEQGRGVTDAKAKVRPRRRAGGRVRLRIDRTRTADERDVKTRARESLEPLTDPFKLRARIHSRLGTGRARVE